MQSSPGIFLVVKNNSKSQRNGAIPSPRLFFKISLLPNVRKEYEYCIHFKIRLSTISTELAQSGKYLKHFEPFEKDFLNGKVDKKEDFACCIIVDPHRCVEPWVNGTLSGDVVTGDTQTVLETDNFFYCYDIFSSLETQNKRSPLRIFVLVVREVGSKRSPLFLKTVDFLSSVKTVEKIVGIGEDQFFYGGRKMLDEWFHNLKNKQARDRGHRELEDHASLKPLVKTQFWAIDFDKMDGPKQGSRPVLVTSTK